MLRTLRSICRSIISEMSPVAVPSSAIVSGVLNAVIPAYSSPLKYAFGSMPKRTMTVWDTLVSSSMSREAPISVSSLLSSALPLHTFSNFRS